MVVTSTSHIFVSGSLRRQQDHDSKLWCAPEYGFVWILVPFEAIFAIGSDFNRDNVVILPG